MNRITRIPRSLIVVGAPLLIIGLMIIISTSSIFAENASALSIGITVDLLILMPLLHALLIRKTSIPITTVVPILIIGVVVSSFILPSENQYYLSLFKTWILPIVELLVVSYVVISVRKAIRKYKATKQKSLDFFSTLKQVCLEILPKGAVNPVVTEISIFYYGFVYWKKRRLDQNEFSYHKDSGTITLLIAVLIIVGIETAVFHSILMKSSYVAAWALTGLSIYSGIQIFGFMKSMLKRPISLEDNCLYLRYGIMSESTIDIRKIVSVEISSKEIELDQKTRKLSILGSLEEHNVIIHLSEEQTLTRLYGIERKYQNLAIYIDDKDEFVRQVKSIQTR